MGCDLIAGRYMLRKKMKNKLLIQHFALLFFIYLIGCQKDNTIAPVYNDYTNDLDSVWTTFELKYPLFDYSKIDWQNSYKEYKDKFTNISEDERNTLLANLLSIFKDPHIYIISSSGKGISTYNPPNFILNYDTTFLNKFISSINWHSESNALGWGIINNIAYMRITSFSPSDIDTLHFGSIIDSIENTTGLIIDLRKNSGGELPVCENIWNRFTETENIVGYQLYRNGPNHDDFAPEIPVIAKPSTGSRYLKTVVLLIGKNCFSAGELFAEAMTSFSNVTSIGDTTFGYVLAPLAYSLNDGTKYSVPIVAYLDASQKPLEWNGVSPDIYISPELVNNNSQNDSIIDNAFEIIIKKRI